VDPAPPSETEVDEEAKPEWFSRLEPRAQRLLIVGVVVGLVAGLLGGFAAGFKVEQNLVETNDVKKTIPKTAASQKITGLDGVVTEKAADSITITSSNGFRVKIKLFATLGVKKAVKASLTDVTVGRAILQRGTTIGTGSNDAAEIIVLPRDSKFTGLKVTAVNGDKVTVTHANTKPLTLNVKSTTGIYTLDASSATQIAKGSEVMANGLGVLGSDTFFANEIIILAPGSAFAKR
jgi:hypothetical protein